MANDSTSDQVHDYMKAREQWEETLRVEGVERERERIIKLLEEAQITSVKIMDSNFEPREIKVTAPSVRADLLIALIKGEN